MDLKLRFKKQKRLTVLSKKLRYKTSGQCHRPVVLTENIVLTHFGLFFDEVVVSGFLSKHWPATTTAGRESHWRAADGGDVQWLQLVANESSRRWVGRVRRNVLRARTAVWVVGCGTDSEKTKQTKTNKICGRHSDGNRATRPGAPKKCRNRYGGRTAAERSGDGRTDDRRTVEQQQQ